MRENREAIKATQIELDRVQRTGQATDALKFEIADWRKYRPVTESVFIRFTLNLLNRQRCLYKCE